MKAYRQDSHTVSLVVWATLCILTASLIAHTGLGLKGGLFQAEGLWILTALLVFGPLALAVYLWRARRVWVSINPLEGIVVSGGRVISWQAIERIERRRPRLRSTTGPTKSTDAGAKEWTEVATDPLGCLVLGEGMLVVGLLLAALFVVWWLIAGVLVPLLIIPVLEVFAPFGDRIKIVTRERTLVLRDLREADDFIREARRRAEVFVR